MPVSGQAGAREDRKGDSSGSRRQSRLKKYTVMWQHTVMAILPREVTNARNIAKYAPLISATIAPCSTLLDIPALSQHWYTYKGGPIGDPTACLVLSAVGLCLNVIANMLLIFRFSDSRRRSRAVSLSLLFWIGKTIVALVNVSYFGALKRNTPDYGYDEGFWAAVLSVIMSGIISCTLLFHYVFAWGHPEGDQEDLRLTGRKFMMSVSVLMFLLGMQGLAFCRLEGWKYLDAVYFSTQCALTIGYGDLVPTSAAGKVLVFPFAVLTISQLANEVSIIIQFVENRAEEKRDRWRKHYSLLMHREAIKRNPYATLVDEMSLIHQIDLHQETMQQSYDLFWSGLSLATFWLVGAAIFKEIEGWGYGDCIYAVMVLSLTIGFGDFTPKTPPGRVVWVVYALMAVPVVTNFAVQTVTGIMYTWSEHRYTRTRFELAREEYPEAFAPHSHFILRQHEKWDPLRDTYMGTMLPGGMERRSTILDRLTDFVLGSDDEDGTKAESSSSKESKRIHDVNETPPKVTRAKEAPADDDEEHARTDVVDAHAAEAAAEEEPPSDEERADGEHDKRRDERAREHVHGRPSTSSRSDKRSVTKQDSARTKGDGRSKHSRKHIHFPEGEEDDDIDGHLSGDVHRSEVRLGYTLVQELIDKVTRLEANGRQMLIDSMERDLARTVLLADRNLQLRDAFHALDAESEENAGCENPEHARHEAEAHRRANIMDSEAATRNEDMLARVQRYRDTFAEILVISSMLLKLEGNELKRFERWRVGDLHHKHKKEAVAEAKRGKRKRAKRGVAYISDFMQGRVTHRHPDPASNMDRDVEAEAIRGPFGESLRLSLSGEEDEEELRKGVHPAHPEHPHHCAADDEIFHLRSERAHRLKSSQPEGEVPRSYEPLVSRERENLKDHCDHVRTRHRQRKPNHHRHAKHSEDSGSDEDEGVTEVKGASAANPAPGQVAHAPGTASHAGPTVHHKHKHHKHRKQSQSQDSDSEDSKHRPRQKYKKKVDQLSGPSDPAGQRAASGSDSEGGEHEHPDSNSDISHTRADDVFDAHRMLDRADVPFPAEDELQGHRHRLRKKLASRMTNRVFDKAENESKVVQKSTVDWLADKVHDIGVVLSRGSDGLEKVKAKEGEAGERRKGSTKRIWEGREGQITTDEEGEVEAEAGCSGRAKTDADWEGSAKDMRRKEIESEELGYGGRTGESDLSKPF